jgi:hypothetical protein
MPRKLPDLAPSSTMPQVAQEAAQVADVILSTMLDSVAQGTAMFDQVETRLFGVSRDDVAAIDDWLEQIGAARFARHRARVPGYARALRSDREVSKATIPNS